MAFKISTMVLAVIVMGCMLASPAAAQGAPYYEPGQLDHMVSRIALYPDPLLAALLHMGFALSGLVWYMTSMPGKSFSCLLPPLFAEELV